MSSQPDGFQCATFHGVSVCVQCGTRCQSVAKKCGRCVALILNSEENICISEEEKSLQLPSNDVREELDLLQAKARFCENMSLKSSPLVDRMQSNSDHLFAPPSNPLNSFQQPEWPRRNSGSDGQLLCQMWEEMVPPEGKDFKVFKDPLAQASFSLDRELEMQRQHQSSGHNRLPLQPDTVSDFPKLEEGSLPEYYSFYSTTTEHTSTQWSDATNNSTMAIKDSTKTSSADESVICGADNDAFPDNVSVNSNSSVWTDITNYLSNEDDMECETSTDAYDRAIKEEAPSSVPCVSGTDPSSSASGQCTRVEDYIYEGCKLNVKTTTECEVSPVFLNVSQAVDASSDFRSCFTFTRATEITPDLFVKHCQDVSTESDSCPVNQETQTCHRPTSEKSTITAVYMSDLDAICEEFGKLQKMEEELRKCKGEMASLGNAGGPKSEQQKSSCECGAASRATRAELRLLALQYAMCQQHCWRRFYTSPQSETSLHGAEALPDALSQTLKSLENNYLMMKRKILNGVPLGNLKPLSVDTERLTATTCYRPSLIYETLLVADVSDNNFNIVEDEGEDTQADEVLKINTTDKEILNQNTAAYQPESAMLSKMAISKRNKGGMPGSIQQPGVCSDVKPGAAKDLNSSDAWFDAEEELECDHQSCKEDKLTGQRDHADLKEQKAVAERYRKIDQGFLLCVSNLPNNTAEHDLLVWFAKYHTNQVSLSSFNNTRVAIVSVRNRKDAEAAVREMNGYTIQGYDLHVEHHKSPADGQATFKESCVRLFPAANKAGSAGERPSTHSSNNFHASRPLRCNLDKLTNICATPTASGTCVPEHYGTMSSFETIMARLSERHPNMGREQIINALQELQRKQLGILSGLPLRDIVDMTSELLTHPFTE